VHIISRKQLLTAGERHSDLVEPLDVWYRTAKKAAWKNLVEVRQQMPTADSVERFVVFNIKGNSYRLITEVFYVSQVILVRHVLTHAEYDKGVWK
jgi:mRNA interferase HigB